MLTSIVKFSKSLSIKVFVGIIILPFIFWGMGDVFQGGNQNIVAKIDRDKIRTQEFVNYLNRLNLTDEQRKNISSTDLIDQILTEYIGRKVIQSEIEDMNIHISDKSLTQIIKNEEIFQKDGKFSRTKYEKFLLESGITAPMFEKNIVEQEKKRQLLTLISDGTLLPENLVISEFKSENQIKKIKYIDLNNYYEKRPPSNNEVKKVYNESKNFFIDEFKNFTYVELTPNNLISKDTYDQAFFDKISEIENKLLDGITVEEVAKNFNLNLKNTGEININKKNYNKIKVTSINDELFTKIYTIKNINEGELFKIKEKFFIVSLKMINKKNRNLNDPEVQEAIQAQLKIQDKLKNNTKIAKDIGDGNFTLIEMKKFAEDNNLQIIDLTIKNLKENKIFTEGMIKRIYLTENKSLNLITDSRLSKNFIIYTIDTDFKKLLINSEDFKVYNKKAKLRISTDLYAMYDKLLNNKYDITINNKTVNRIKNSF